MVLKEHHCQPRDIARPSPAFLRDQSRAPARLMMLTVPHESVTVALLASLHLLWLIEGASVGDASMHTYTVVQVNASAQASVAVHDQAVQASEH